MKTLPVASALKIAGIFGKHLLSSIKIAELFVAASELKIDVCRDVIATC